MSDPAPMSDAGMVEIIDYLGKLLGDWFSHEVSFIYFGDIGTYPPSAFKDEKGNQRACISIAPRYFREVPSSRNGAHEERELGLNITVMVNMIPYFEAFPKEAYGERALATLITRIYQFLSDHDLVTLHDRVSSAVVRDIEFNWAERGNAAVREATLIWEAKVVVAR